MNAATVFGTDYTDLEAVVRLASRLARQNWRFTQYVFKAPGQANFNITMQMERVGEGRCYAICKGTSVTRIAVAD